MQLRNQRDKEVGDGQQLILFMHATQFKFDLVYYWFIILNFTELEDNIKLH